MIMLALRLDGETERRLEALAKRTGRTKSHYAREAITAYLEDLEDYYLAEERLRQFRESGEEAVSLEQLKIDLGLDD
jgi:RHH-type rel operon transcriptional repressor/antitoxin RelB